VCQEKFKDANTAFVKRKINNLRTVFRRELNKVLKSKTTGSSVNEIYIPTLWYYDLLSFTTEDESDRVRISSLDANYNSRSKFICEYFRRSKSHCFDHFLFFCVSSSSSIDKIRAVVSNNFLFRSILFIVRKNKQSENEKIP
jgi:hypothetical protein